MGMLLALALRRFDIPPRKRYEWEDEPAQAEEDPPWWSEVEQGGRQQ